MIAQTVTLTGQTQPPSALPGELVRCLECRRLYSVIAAWYHHEYCCGSDICRAPLPLSSEIAHFLVEYDPSLCVTVYAETSTPEEANTLIEKGVEDPVVVRVSHNHSDKCVEVTALSTNRHSIAVRIGACLSSVVRITYNHEELYHAAA